MFYRQRFHNSHLGQRKSHSHLFHDQRQRENLPSCKSPKIQTRFAFFDGQKLDYEEFVYYMMNKPQGAIQRLKIPNTRLLGFVG